MQTLNQTPKSTEVLIEDITDALVKEQLVSMGFTIGSKLKVVSKLPFKGAIAIESDYTRVAIRATDASFVVVSNS